MWTWQALAFCKVFSMVSGTPYLAYYRMRDKIVPPFNTTPGEPLLATELSFHFTGLVVPEHRPGRSVEKKE